MTFDPARAEAFRYEGYDLDERTGVLRCLYALDGWTFEERVSFGEGGPVGASVDAAAVEEAARLVFLLAGVSYYKAAAPPVVDLTAVPMRAGEVDFLRTYYVEGLGEYAYRNGVDLSGITFEGAREATAPPAHYAPGEGRPLVPFGGGIDSIVSVELVTPRFPDTALFVVSRSGDRFASIERAAAVTGLPVVRASRELDPEILRSADHGFRNGHVPVTGILSAIAVMAAVLDGRDAVVMSNEWSASIGNVEVDGRTVNHQFSKSLAFETAFRDVLAGAFGPDLAYFSLLRSFTELWIAERFARLRRYHHAFLSCNRGFAIDPAQRLDTWCGRCDKCCFIDLVLSPFVPAAELGSIFGGREPLLDESLADRFRSLLATSADLKPWECVGDVGECRTAAVLGARRDDRAATPLLHRLVDELGEAAPHALAQAPQLLRPAGPHHVPEAYAPADLVG